MERREILQGMTMATAVALAAGAGSSPEASAQQAEPSVPSTPRGIGLVDVKKISPDYFIPERFKGKTLIVTGCARGMGQLAARRAAREGANIVGVDWIRDEGEATIESINAAGGNARFVYGDVGDTDTCDRMVEVAVREFGGLDLALNNAGVMDAVYSGEPVDYEKQKHLTFQQVHAAGDEYWEKVMRTNATGVFKSMRAELRQFIAQMRGGAIVNVGSVTALIGFGGTCAYSASKYAVSALTCSAAIDYAAYGVRVNSVNMGTTDTPMVQRARALLAARAREPDRGPQMGLVKIRSLLETADSQQRSASPAEQVAVMLFLLSDEASNLTGALYATDGGYTAY